MIWRCIPRRSNRTLAVTGLSSPRTEPSTNSLPPVSPPPSNSNSHTTIPSPKIIRHSPRLIQKKWRSRNDIWLDEIKGRQSEYRFATSQLTRKHYKKRITSLATSIIASCLDTEVWKIDQIQLNQSLTSECLKVLQAVQYEIECITRVPGLASPRSNDDDENDEEDHEVTSGNKFQTTISMLTSLSQSKLKPTKTVAKAM